MSFEKAPGGGEELLAQIKELAKRGKADGHVKAFGEIVTVCRVEEVMGMHMGL